jgi:hypothetical protein
MSGKTRKKFLASLIFFLLWILAAQSGLLGLLPLPQGFSLPSFGGMLFGGGTHGVPNPFALAVDVIAYGLIVYGLVSALFRLVERGRHRRQAK